MITYDEVIADLEAIVAKKGADFVYTSKDAPVLCSYYKGWPERVDAMAPSCIVGYVLDRHELLDAGFDGVAENQSPLAWRSGGLGDFFDDAALSALAHAQGCQDEAGNTWGQALEAAKAVRG